jgi:hypothetical protein
MQSDTLPASITATGRRPPPGVRIWRHPNASDLQREEIVIKVSL